MCDCIVSSNDIWNIPMNDGTWLFQPVIFDILKEYTTSLLWSCTMDFTQQSVFVVHGKCLNTSLNPNSKCYLWQIVLRPGNIVGFFWVQFTIKYNDFILETNHEIKCITSCIHFMLFHTPWPHTASLLLLEQVWVWNSDWLWQLSDSCIIDLQPLK